MLSQYADFFLPFRKNCGGSRFANGRAFPNPVSYYSGNARESKGKHARNSEISIFIDEKIYSVDRQS